MKLPPLYPRLPLHQHPDEKRYQFATPSTLKPTQIKCSEGSINQIPAWTEIKGDIRLTPFYNIHDCMKKFEGYVQELNDGKSCDESAYDHVTSLATGRLVCRNCSKFALTALLSLLSLPPPPILLPPPSSSSSLPHLDITQLPTRGPCSKYTLDLEEGKFRGELKLTFEGEPFKVRGRWSPSYYLLYDNVS